MQRSRVIHFVVVCVLSSLISILISPGGGVGQSMVPAPPAPYPWAIPPGLPRPIVPADNPMTVEKVELGRHLFYDPRLSVTGEFSCGSCHLQSLAFTDGKPVAIGATGEAHPRNAMSLTNVAYNPVLTWANPLMTDLEQQALVPLFGDHPVEMGMAGRETDILTGLRSDPAYREGFASAFGPGESAITIHTLIQAIAAFERSLISFNSPYDRYRYGGDSDAISEAAKRGETLFHSERLECFHCHGGINFTDSIQHERLAFREIAFHNTGLYNIDGQGAYPPDNTGVYDVTQQASDMGRFRAPTLRNIALTAPYMHDGSLPTLEAVIDHYRVGGRAIATGEYAGIGHDSPLKSSFISGFALTPAEKRDLLAFLHSLTDDSFVHNPAHQNPYAPPAD